MDGFSFFFFFCSRSSSSFGRRKKKCYMDHQAIVIRNIFLFRVIGYSCVEINIFFLSFDDRIVGHQWQTFRKNTVLQRNHFGRIFSSVILMFTSSPEKTPKADRQAFQAAPFFLDIPWWIGTFFFLPPDYLTA